MDHQDGGENDSDTASKVAVLPLSPFGFVFGLFLVFMQVVMCVADGYGA